MAIWGVGFHFGKKCSQKEKFINKNYISIGYSEKEAPEYYAMMREIRVGDIVYLKSWAIRNNTLHIRAIGKVISPMKQNISNITVDWLIKDIDETIALNTKYRQRVTSIYKEYNDTVISTINKYISLTEVKS